MGLSIALCHGISAAQAPYPSGDEILDQIDRNLSSVNRIFTSKMVIHGRRGSRTVVSKSWLKGEEKAFTEYLSPPREQGVKMLKLEDNLWMYSPSTRTGRSGFPGTCSGSPSWVRTCPTRT